MTNDSIKKSILRNLLSGKDGLGTRGQASLSDIAPGVNPGNVFARQRTATSMAYQAAGDSEQENKAALESQKQQARLAEMNLKGQQHFNEMGLKNQFTQDATQQKSDATRQAARQKVGLDVKKAILMKHHGLDPVGKALASHAGKPYGGFKRDEAIPQEMNGLPLESIDTADTGFMRPKYGRSKSGQEEMDAITNENIKKKYSQQQAAQEPGILQKMKRFFVNPSAEASQSGDEYDTLSEDSLYARALNGDKKAIEIGKKKFGKA